MRITPFTIFNQLTRSLNRTLETYSSLNVALASGKKINAPSDDPAGMQRSIDYHMSINENDQYGRNIDLVTNRLNFTNTVMTSFDEALTNVVSLATSNARGNADPVSRSADAGQAASFRDMLFDLANSQYIGEYIFSGFATDTQAYAAGTYAYQGDAGVINVPIGKNTSLSVNTPGDSAFSYTLAAPTSQQISGGRYVYYTPGGGTTVNVEIRDTDNTTVLDTFSFSNVIQMADLLSTAIGAGDTPRIEALREPFTQVQQQFRTAQTQVGSRLARLENQSDWYTQATNSLKDALSSVEDANTIEIAAKLKTTEVTLSALRDSASRVLSQSLFDFLK